MVEVATFGSDIIAFRICKELTVAMRYKLLIVGQKRWDFCFQLFY